MKATDSQQVQSKASTSSESAFDQEVGGKTMAPPKFGLEASGGEAAQAAEGGGQMPDDEFEALFWKIVAKAKETGSDHFLCNAVGVVMDNYGWNREMVTIKVEKGQKEWGVTNGKANPEAHQTIVFSKSLFRQDFGLIVRIIGHEYQHVLDNIGDNPSKNIYDAEFRAYYWEITNMDVIQHRDLRNVKIAIYNAKKYYQFLNNELQEKYTEQYQEILNVEAKL